MKVEGKTKWILAAAAVAGLLLIIVPQLIIRSDKTEKNEPTADVTYYTRELEERIRSLIMELEGIERASILITLEDTGEYVYAENRTEGDSSSSSDYVIIGSGADGETVKLTQIFPKVRGVAVVCTAGNEVAVRERVISLLSSVLGISSARITVAG